jgi:uncharacterized membrane protein
MKHENNEDQDEREQRELRRLRQGSYADVLFVLIPFLAIGIQYLWHGETDRLMTGPEISIAVATIAGLSISKFIQGLVLDPAAGVYRERLVFIIAATFLFLLMPAVILAMNLNQADEPPRIIAYVQAGLLVIAITLYIHTVRIIRAREEKRDADRQDEDEIGESGDFPIQELESAAANTNPPKRRD